VKRVAIIGGGLAGLACARAVRLRGLDVTVFEAGERAGGRDAAAFFLLAPELFSNTFQLIDDVGLRADVLPIEPHAGQVYQGRVYRHRVSSATGLLMFKGLNIVDKALLPRMAYLLARHSSHIDFHAPERGLNFDTETVASFVKRELSQNVLNYVAGPLISTLFFYGSDETSAWLYMVLAKHMHNVRMSTLRGGVNRLAPALSSEVRVMTGCAIGNIETDGQSYVVNGERFSDVVLAVPGDAVLGIGGVQSLLSEEDRQFFKQCRYQRIVTVQVATEHPVDGQCYAVSIPRVERKSASAICFHDYVDPSSVPDGTGLLTVGGSGPGVNADSLLEDLRTLYPVVPAQTKAVEWITGMPMFPPRRYHEIIEFEKRGRRPGLFFCGDYLLGPLIEGAITTGLRAANCIDP
jgi:protoporphyrinogen/coproporphyrinogen III oxidase